MAVNGDYTQGVGGGGVQRNCTGGVDLETDNLHQQPIDFGAHHPTRYHKWVTGWMRARYSHFKGKFGTSIFFQAEEHPITYFMDLQKVYGLLEYGRCLEILQICGIRKGVIGILDEYWEWQHISLNAGYGLGESLFSHGVSHIDTHCLQQCMQWSGYERKRSEIPRLKIMGQGIR